MAIFIHKKPLSSNDFEVVERKGIGHPDTLSDALGEYLSAEYSKYTLRKFGAVLHHNFDKVGLLGGSSHVSFGKGYLKSPIRVLVNGRVSTKFADELIPIRKLLQSWIVKFFTGRLENVDPEQDLEITFNLSNQSSPGKVYEDASMKNLRRFWFEPRSLSDLGDLKKPKSNDTSLGVGYAPFSRLENLVLQIESHITGAYRKRNKWVGTDVKILAVRVRDGVEMTMCIPQISTRVKSLDEYRSNLAKARREVESLVRKSGFKQLELSINTRDNYQTQELYLTATGSSIESGDEGLTGRGNRINGLISPTRPMSMEGACGKNPVYHIGKLYYVAAFKLAASIFKKYGVHNEVFIASQSGRPLLDPWVVNINVSEDYTGELLEIERFAIRELKKISELTPLIISGKVRLN